MGRSMTGGFEDAPLGKGMQGEVEFTVRWASNEARHEERYLARQVDPARDLLPPGMDAELRGARAGHVAGGVFAPGKLVPGYRPRKVADLPRDCFRKFKFGGRLIEPQAGRFYPFSLLTAHPGIRTTDVRPAFRVLGVEGGLRVDINHPLAARELEVQARVVGVYSRRSRGKLPDWIEEACVDGPGMQARAGELRTRFAFEGAFGRVEDAEDAIFYAAPRLVAHLDATAAGHLAGAYAERVPEGARVLDLMSSVHSHLPGDKGLDVTGLGMNAEELAANPLLRERVVHDLNRDPVLPFADESFDVVVCSLSVEYLTDPWAVAREMRRVLRPGGRCLVSFSNRWFPEKVVALWPQLHEFERMGLVLDCLSEAGFTSLETLSIRNHWRPEDDPHFAETWDSDPVYLVGGVNS